MVPAVFLPEVLHDSRDAPWYLCQCLCSHGADKPREKQSRKQHDWQHVAAAKVTVPSCAHPAIRGASLGLYYGGEKEVEDHSYSTN